MKILGLILLSLLAFVVLLLLLVLFVPIRGYAEYRDKIFGLKVKSLCFHYTILPQKKKKKEKKKKPKKEKKKKKTDPAPDKKAKKKKKKKLDLGAIKQVLVKHLPPILRVFRIPSLHLRWDVHAEDAAKTAITYGAACSAIGGMLSIMDRYSRYFGKAVVDIFPDYDGEGKGVEGDITLSLRLGPLIWRGILLIIDLIRYKIL